MFDQLKEKYPLLKDKWDDYMSHYHRIEVPAGTVLIKQGQIAKKGFLVEKGCLRASVGNNGKECTFQFFFENEMVSSGESFRKQIPSSFTIETIEPCVLYILHKKDWDIMMNDISKIPGMKTKGFDAMLERQYEYMRQFISSINDSPEERYMRLVTEKPHILRRVPLQYIASYLGVTPVSLSRIRKRLSKKLRVKQDC